IVGTFVGPAAGGGGAYVCGWPAGAAVDVEILTASGFIFAPSEPKETWPSRFAGAAAVPVPAVFGGATVTDDASGGMAGAYAALPIAHGSLSVFDSRNSARRLAEELPQKHV